MPPIPGDPVCCLKCGEVATVNEARELCSLTEAQIVAMCLKYGLDPAKARRKSQMKGQKRNDYTTN